jgi:hypothetical protein
VCVCALVENSCLELCVCVCVSARDFGFFLREVAGILSLSALNSLL